MNVQTAYAPSHTYSATHGGNVVSVNPGRMTLGNLNALTDNGFANVMPRVSVLSETHHSGSVPSLAAILFPVKQMNAVGSVVLLLVRLAFAAMLVYGGLMTLTEGVSTIGSLSTNLWGAIQLALGFFVATGFLTRIVMILPAITFGMLALSAADFATALQPMAFSLVSILLLMLGSGWLSADSLIRVALRRSHKRRTRAIYPLHRSLTPDYPLARLSSPE